MAPRARVVAYVRVSTDKQVEQGLSLEAQQAKLAAYAELYELDLSKPERRRPCWWSSSTG